MPAQVALSMLTEPKAKMTARMRKTCAAARERKFVAPPTVASACNRPMKPFSIYKLLLWLQQCARRRAKLQRVYNRLARKQPDGVRSAEMREISRVSSNLEILREQLESEMRIRRDAQVALAFTRSKHPHIDPMVRRQRALYAVICSQRQ